MGVIKEFKQSLNAALNRYRIPKRIFHICIVNNKTYIILYRKTWVSKTNTISFQTKPKVDLPIRVFRFDDVSYPVTSKLINFMFFENFQ